MKTETAIKRISPMLVAADVAATVAFYAEVLGFRPTLNSPGYAVVERDGATIHFMKAANEQVLEAVREHTNIYIEVSDIASFWAHVSQFKGSYRIRDLFDRDYGMREFHIVDSQRMFGVRRREDLMAAQVGRALPPSRGSPGTVCPASSIAS